MVRGDPFPDPTDYAAISLEQQTALSLSEPGLRILSVRGRPDREGKILKARPGIREVLLVCRGAPSR